MYGPCGINPTAWAAAFFDAYIELLQDVKLEMPEKAKKQGIYGGEWECDKGQQKDNQKGNKPFLVHSLNLKNPLKTGALISQSIS